MWVPEIHEHCPDTPYILVGLQSDLRDNFSKDNAKEYDEPVPREQGEEMKRKIGATYYVECSANTNSNLKEVFELAIKASLQPKPRPGSNENTENEGHCCNIA